MTGTGWQTRANEALKAGGRIGPYEVLAAIGTGGIGEVYRAGAIRA